jgi:hypothetical protein
MSRVQNFDQLLCLDDESFIQETYKTILRRSPEVADVRHYLRVLDLGADKWGIVINIAMSPEALRHEQTLDGLANALNWRRKEMRRPLGPIYRAIRIASRFYLQLRRLDSRLSRIEAALSRLEAQGTLSPHRTLQPPSRRGYGSSRGSGEETFPNLTLSAQRILQKLTR